MLFRSDIKVIGGGFNGDKSYVSKGVVASGSVPISLWMTNVTFSDFDFGSSYALDIQTTTDSKATILKIIGCNFLSTCDYIQIARGFGGTATNKNVAFIGCGIDCEVFLDTVVSTQFVGNLISKPVTGLNNIAYTSFIGNKFSNITGTAPVVVPSTSPYFVFQGNTFVGCDTLPSFSTAASNTNWSVFGNTGINNLFANYRLSTMTEPNDVNTIYVDVSDGILKFKDYAGVVHSLS